MIGAAATLGLLTSVVATSSGLLPERIDVTHVFAAYGAGAIVGDAVAARWARVDGATLTRRYGLTTMGVAVIAWVLALIGRLG